MKRGGGRRGSGLGIARRSVQAGFLALFVALAFKAAYPPLGIPPANALLRLDPLAGVYSLLVQRSASALVEFWPAWVLLGLTILAGRFFCGWLCPLGTCFDAVGAVKPKALKYYRPDGRYMKRLLASEKEGAAPRRIRPKYFILAAVLALGLAGVNLLYFASPLVVMNRSVYYILVPQVPVFLLLLLLLALAYRTRFWCEELCPMGALMSLVSMIGKKLPAMLSPLVVVKDADACIDCGACFKACDFGVTEPFLKRDGGRLLSADCTTCTECVAVCPSGGALALESMGMTVHRSGSERKRPASAPSPQVGENSVAPALPRFTLDRRGFIGSLGLGAILLAGYGVGLHKVSEPVLRMPGAQDEAKFLAECNRCGECTRTCPTGCIRPMGLEGGFQNLWVPRFYPRTAGCVFDQCDQACARVCPALAIERLESKDVRIGLAHVDKNRCLGWRGRRCLVCQERCRFDAISAEGLRPVVLEDKCTGCGACEQTCPTEPASIRIFRLGESASWPSGGGGGRGRQGG